MTKCIIHIGMHKAGSSSIQYSFQGYEDDRFLYGQFETDRFHTVPIMAAFSARAQMRSERRERRGKSGMKGSADLYEADLRKTIRRAEGRTLILSSEGIYSSFARADLERMRDYFDRHFEEYRFIAYVRPPGSYMSSLFQQNVKVVGYDQLNVSRLYRGYERTFAKIDEVFGAERVHLVKFDPANFPGNDVVLDFCERFGIPLPPEKIVRANESISRERVALLFTLHRFCRINNLQISRRVIGHLGGALKGFGSTRFRLSPDVVRPVLEAKAEDIRWIEQRIGQSMQENLGPHREGDVRDEQDLLEPSPSMAAELRKSLGVDMGLAATGTPEELACIVLGWAAAALAGSVCSLTTGKPYQQNDFAGHKWKSVAESVEKGKRMPQLKKPAEGGQSGEPRSREDKAANRRLRAIKTRLKEIVEERKQLQAELSQLLGKKSESASGATR